MKMFAYAGCRTTRGGRGNGISVFEVDGATGQWSLVQIVPDLVNPVSLSVGPTDRALYCAHADGHEITAFAIHSQTGRLEFLNTEDSGGINPAYVNVHPSNTFVLAPNYGSGTLAVLPIKDNGALAPVSQLIELPGEPGPHRVEQPHSRPHQVRFAPGGFILVPDKGLDRVFVFRLDAATKLVVEAEVPWVDTRRCAGPRHVAFHPTRSSAYVVNELDSTITTYVLDIERGTLEPVQIVPCTPPSFVGQNKAADILVAPSGDELLVSNRGHDSIGVFTIGSSGTLTPSRWVSSEGRTPRAIAIDPLQTCLHVANEGAGTIVSFKFEGKGIGDTPVQSVTTPSPTFITFAMTDA